VPFPAGRAPAAIGRYRCRDSHLPPNSILPAVVITPGPDVQEQDRLFTGRVGLLPGFAAQS